MTVVVLGADGYIGWPLLCRLAHRIDEPLCAVDDLSKRRRVEAEGYASALPIPPFADRMDLLRRSTGRRDLDVVETEVSASIEALVRERRPRAVFHLAQIPSAPYSMKDLASARETLLNNEVGNLALLFALRDHAPDTHLIKMGSMGEYAACGVALAEGYVEAILDGEAATAPVPFPRAADDVYHVTKINDTCFVAMACRVWGLPATDVMQSVVYGIHTPESRADADLCTRFDCDSTFGSVLNRMVAQALVGTPLTVYGAGETTTGLIALPDALAALVHWLEHPPAPGQHRVVNQTVETRISILEIARLVQRVGANHGTDVEVTHAFDPRHEGERPGTKGPARNLQLRAAGLPLTVLEKGVNQLWQDLTPYRDRLQAAMDPPYVDWRTGQSPRVGTTPRPA